MKTITLSTVVALAMTGPVFAEAADFAAAHFAQDDEGADRSAVLSAPSEGDATAVIAHFAQDYETGDGPRVQMPHSQGEVLSTSNSALAASVAEHLDN